MTDNVAKPKIDMHFLLQKYGSAKQKNKPPPPEPKYYEEGFSVEFKLSHAYRALEKQEQEQSKVRLRPKPKLSRKALKKLKATNPSVHPQDEGSKHTIIDRGTIKERVNTDLDKYKEIGRKKRESQKAEDIKRRIEEEKKNTEIGCLHGQNVKVRPASFWRHLMNGKTISDIVANENEHDNTFITNAEPESLKLNLHRRCKKHRSHSPKDRNRSLSKNRLNAVEEWEKRKERRKQKRLEQSARIRQSVNRKTPTSKNAKHAQSKSEKSKSPERSKRDASKSPKVQLVVAQKTSCSAFKALHNTSVKSGTKPRPKSAPAFQSISVSKQNDEMLDEGHDRNDIPNKSKHESRVTKHLRSNFLSHTPVVAEQKPETAETGNNQTSQEGEADKTAGPRSARPASALAGFLDQNEDEAEAAPRNKLIHKPTKFLFNMCHCNKVSKAKTLGNLQRTKKVGGVIEVLTCNGGMQEEVCPFCVVIPNSRIQAWLDDVEMKTHLFDTE